MKKIEVDIINNGGEGNWVKASRRKMVLEEVEDNLGKVAADEKGRERAEIDSGKNSAKKYVCTHFAVQELESEPASCEVLGTTQKKR